MKTKSKILGTLVACACLLASQAAITVSAADGITVKITESADTLGYKVKGYYSGDGVTFTEVNPSKNGNTYYFAGVQGDENYSQFYYDVIDYNGNTVQSKVLGNAGDLFYVESDFYVPVDIDLSFEEIYAADMLKSGATAEEARSYINGAYNSDGTGDSSVGTSGSTTNGNSTGSNNITGDTGVTDPSVYISVDDGDIDAGVIVNITSDAAIDQLYNSEFKIVLTGSDGKQYSVDFPAVKSRMTKSLSIPDGTYSVAVGIGSLFVNTSVQGDTSATVSNGLCELNFKVTPACILQVVKTGYTDCEFAIVGAVSGQYNISNGNVGVQAGATYTVTDLSVMKQFQIQIPTNTSVCMLDLATVDGTPVNSAAQTDAVLNETASDDNPFNIPETGDTAEAAKSSTAVPIVSCGVIVALGTAAVIAKKRSN
jgi:hypothetical protein